MLRVDCYDFYKLGQILHPITEISEGSQLAAVWPSLFFARTEINSFFNTFPLKTARNPARQLYQAIVKLVPEEWDDFSIKDNDGELVVLSYSDANAITTAAKELEAVLKAELSGWDTYFVSQKGAYNTSDLVNQAEMLLSEQARLHLSTQAFEDIRQCGTCLAFNLGTAAAFHIVRCTETFIWKYYELTVGEMPKRKMRNWGAYVTSLEKCSNANAKIIGWLRHIKDEYRNPVMHPDKSVSSDEAMIFISACLALVGMIVGELQKSQSLRLGTEALDGASLP